WGKPLPDLTAASVYLFRFSAPAQWSDVLSNFRSVDPLCPPLYALLLNCSIRVFGFGDISVRLLSVVFSLLTIAVIYMISWRCLGLRTAIFAAVLQTVSPFDIYYAQEARMYALLTLTAASSTGSLFFLLSRSLSGRTRVTAWFAYVIATWAMI